MSQALKLHEKLKLQVRTERKITHEVLMTIQEFDITQSFRELGYSSLYTYLVQAHGYSEGAANRRLQAARLLRQVPEVAQQIQEGKINLSQLALAQSAFKQEEKETKTPISASEKKSTLKNLEGKNHFETQKTLVDRFPDYKPAKPKPIPTKNKTVQTTLEFSDDNWNKIQSLLAHMSHKVPDQKLESLLLYWADQVEKKKQKTFADKGKDGSKNEAIPEFKTTTECDFESKSQSKSELETKIKLKLNTSDELAPSQALNCSQAKDNLKFQAQLQPQSLPHSQTKLQSQPPSQAGSQLQPQPRAKPHNSDLISPPMRRRSAKSLRKYISVKTKRQVFQKAQHRCEFVSALTGQKCESASYLDIDHKTPLALGGSNNVGNLRVLCRSHNHLLAKQMHLSGEYRSSPDSLASP